MFCLRIDDIRTCATMLAPDEDDGPDVLYGHDRAPLDWKAESQASDAKTGLTRNSNKQSVDFAMLIGNSVRKSRSSTVWCGTHLGSVHCTCMIPV